MPFRSGGRVNTSDGKDGAKMRNVTVIYLNFYEIISPSPYICLIFLKKSSAAGDRC